MKTLLSLAIVLAAWLCRADEPPSTPPARADLYAAWVAARDVAFLADAARVTITTAEYAALTNGMEHIRRAAERRRKAREESRKRREKATAEEAEAVRARGVQRVREIRRLREEAKKGGAK